MKLWILRPVEGLDKADDPWDKWYDKSFGFVVRAETEEDARAIAHANAGDENRSKFLSRNPVNTNQPWKESKYSTCVELLPEGDAGLVMQDFAAA